MKITLQRIKENDKQTIGELFVNDKKFYILELPWKDNQFQVSRIPAGIYKVVRRWSRTYKYHFHILDVPNRDMILIHIGNYNFDTKGCLIPGMFLTDINKDGYIDVADSGKAMTYLRAILPDKFEIEIRDINYIGDLDPKSERRV